MGLDIATKAFDLKNNSINAMTTLALAYHYTNQIAERDQLVKQIKESQDFDKDHFEFYQSLFDGKIQWR